MSAPTLTEGDVRLAAMVLERAGRVIRTHASAGLRVTGVKVTGAEYAAVARVSDLNPQWCPPSMVRVWDVPCLVRAAT